MRELGEGWDELEIPYGHGLDAWLVEFGPDVVVLEPAELRADVVDRLRAEDNVVHHVYRDQQTGESEYLITQSFFIKFLMLTDFVVTTATLP